MIQLMIIGLDGATFRVIKHLCNEDKLPNLRKLMVQGVYGTLESTFPPVTGPAWASLATGKNPGKTGIFDFLNRTSKESFAYKPFSSVHIETAKAYWDYLSEAEIKVGIINYPGLFPPYEINGIMVSGTPSDPQEEISYPKEFKQLLVKKCGNYQIRVPWRNPEYSKKPSLFLKHAFQLLEINYKTMELMLDFDLEVLTFVVSASDFAQHYMWKYFDSTHPHYRKESAEKYGPAFVQIWQKIDKILGLAIFKTSSQNANILVVSDHGFGSHRSRFYINSWLEREGYLFKRTKLIRARQVQIAMAELMMKVSKKLSTRLFRVANLGRIPRLSFTSEIDIKRSLAFKPMDTSNVVGAICINRQATNESNFEAIRNEIVEKLKETCRILGLRVEVHSPHELYVGQYVNLAPDILFQIDDFECTIHPKLNQGSYLQPADHFHSGDHRKQGVFIAYGPDIRSGDEIEGAKIYDVAPTILHILGLSVPEDMDGRVLKEIFTEDSEIAKRHVKHQKVCEERRKRSELSEAREREKNSKERKEEIKRRLRSLGYF